MLIANIVISNALFTAGMPLAHTVDDIENWINRKKITKCRNRSDPFKTNYTDGKLNGYDNLCLDVAFDTQL